MPISEHNRFYFLLGRREYRLLSPSRNRPAYQLFTFTSGYFLPCFFFLDCWLTFIVEYASGPNRALLVRRSGTQFPWILISLVFYQFDWYGKISLIFNFQESYTLIFVVKRNFQIILDQLFIKVLEKKPKGETLPRFCWNTVLHWMLQKILLISKNASSKSCW